MLRETVVFFLLLGILATGFVQSMIALDAADTELSDPWSIINILLQVSVARLSLYFRWSLRHPAGQSLTTPRLFPQALLGSPDFDSTAKGFSPPFGLMCVPACLCVLRRCVLLTVLWPTHLSQSPQSIYYAWSFLTIIILLNILIALFGLCSSCRNLVVCLVRLTHSCVLGRYGLLGHRGGRDQSVPHALLVQDDQHDPRTGLLRLPVAIQLD